MRTFFYFLFALGLSCSAALLIRSSVRFYREVMRQRLERERRWKERTVWRAHVAIINTEKGKTVTLPMEEWDALMERLNENKCMIIPTDDELGIVMYGRNVYHEGWAPTETLEIPF